MQPKTIREAALGSAFAHELERFEENRAWWRDSLDQFKGIEVQLKNLGYAGSAYEHATRQLADLSLAATSIGEANKAMLRSSATIGAYEKLQAAQRTQREQLRKMLNPLDDLRKRFAQEAQALTIANDLARGTTLETYRDLVRSSLSSGDPAGTSWIQEISDVAHGTLRAGLPAWLKDFERANTRWGVPEELLGVVGSLNDVQRLFGKVALPTIDWGSAAALATVLGPEGLEAQLAHLGVESDGSLREISPLQERGLLSRRQSDAVSLIGQLLAVIGILMTIGIFVYQERSSAAQQAKNDELAAKQLRQLESLNMLVAKALEQAEHESEEHFVVRERVASVRSAPEHGSAVQGRLLPNEVVRGLDRKGRWVEVEYYHWLREEYRTGWVLKHYLERVPANYAKKAP